MNEVSMSKVKSYFKKLELWRVSESFDAINVNI